MTPSVLVALHAIALWPVGLWAIERVTTRGGSLWGLVPLAVATALLARRPVGESAGHRLTLPSALLVAYVVAWSALPPLVGAAVGVASLSALLSRVRLGRAFDPALAGLLLLALPDISTLQFFVGWPFRVGVAATVATMLDAMGVTALREGTILVVDGRAIAVDAACSGVWMGWGALLTWFAAAVALRLRPVSTLQGLGCLVPLVFVANVLRTSSLTVAEARLDLPTWVHEGVGMVVFAGLALAIVHLAERLPRRERRLSCATQ